MNFEGALAGRIEHCNNSCLIPRDLFPIIDFHRTIILFSRSQRCVNWPRKRKRSTTQLALCAERVDFTRREETKQFFALRRARVNYHQLWQMNILVKAIVRVRKFQIFFGIFKNLNGTK